MSWGVCACLYARVCVSDSLAAAPEKPSPRLRSFRRSGATLCHPQGVQPGGGFPAPCLCSLCAFSLGSCFVLLSKTQTSDVTPSSSRLWAVEACLVCIGMHHRCEIHPGFLRLSNMKIKLNHLFFCSFNWVFIQEFHTHDFMWSHAAAAKSLQSCLTLCDPIDGSPPGSPLPGILQARTLEWGATAFSNIVP